MAAIGDGSGTKTGLAEGNDTNVEDDGHSKDLDLEYNNYIVLSLFFQVAFFLLWILICCIFLSIFALLYFLFQLFMSVILFCWKNELVLFNQQVNCAKLLD